MIGEYKDEQRQLVQKIIYKQAREFGNLSGVAFRAFVNFDQRL